MDDLCVYFRDFLYPLFRSSLGEYYKDSRNLKRIKDTSEFPCRGPPPHKLLFNAY